MTRPMSEIPIVPPDKTQKLMAFWYNHGCYPQILCGEITHFLYNGRIETREFGHSATFKPLLVMPFKEGKELECELNKLKNKHMMALKEFEQSFQDQLQDLFKTKKIGLNAKYLDKL